MCLGILDVTLSFELDKQVRHVYNVDTEVHGASDAMTILDDSTG